MIDKNKKAEIWQIINIDYRILGMDFMLCRLVQLTFVTILGPI